MAIDLTYAPEIEKLIDKTRDFTRRRTCSPSRTDHAGDVAVAGGDPLRVEMQAAAKEAGVFAPHAPVEYGGHGPQHERSRAGLRGSRLLAVRADRR